MRLLKHKFSARNKYNAQPTYRDGMRFDSKKEAEFYDMLKLQKESGFVVLFLRQSRFDLPGNIKYTCDFQVFYSDGTVKFIDVKGFSTKSFLRSKKMVEELYWPVEIEVV